jgi:hypothetical protein
MSRNPWRVSKRTLFLWRRKRSKTHGREKRRKAAAFDRFMRELWKVLTDQRKES